MPSKIISLAEMVSRIPDGTSLALGGSFLHRGPFAFVRELIRQKKRDLEIIKQSPGYDIDILCRAGCVKKALAGIVAMEGNFGLAPWYRKAVEKKQIVLEEHACMTLTAGLRASAFGVPFQPVGGVHGSDLAALNKWASIKDPYGSGEEVWVIPAIKPDIAVIHANEVNELGDTRIYGTFNWDRIMTRAAKQVFVIAEKLDSIESFQQRPELTLVPSFMVQAMSIVPNGAWPGSCWPLYEIDYPAVEEYMDTAGSLDAHMAKAPEIAKARMPSWSGFSYIVTNLARFIRPGEVTFSGVNSTPPMLACLLAKRAYDFDFVYINVAGGVQPTPSKIPLSSSDPILSEGSTAIFANEDFYDLCTRGGMDLCFLGAAQVDGLGRTNVSAIGDWHNPKVRLPGGGGGAVMLPTARRAVTWRTEHSKRTMVEKLDFITASGGMAGVVTPIAVFVKRDGRLVLQSWHPEATLDEVRERTGFTLDANGAQATPVPTEREIEALRSLDPAGQFERDANVALR